MSSEVLEQLVSIPGSVHKKKRIGRGMGSGWGGTAGKGHKGQKARSGAPIRRGYQGGQMPLQMRVPKFGFSNESFRDRFQIVDLASLTSAAEWTPESLRQKKLAREGRIKILGNSEILTPIKVTAHAFSKAAKAAIEKAGGQAIEIK